MDPNFITHLLTIDPNFLGHPSRDCKVTKVMKNDISTWNKMCLPLSWLGDASLISVIFISSP